ncbi:MAG TPA: hypothetical protein VFX97_00605 [Pyrinomonadaceae bacterium]|nr:hypothetical protein [Pyrinomonadaceae bacterium]
MAEPSNSEHNSAQTSLEEIKFKTAVAELRKLQLEVTELERGTKLESRIGRFVPIITAVISIAGFILGVVIFGNEQSKGRQAREDDRKSRELNDYRIGYEQLLLFSSNDKLTIARVLTLKQDLDALKESIYLTPTQREEQEQRLAGSICNLISRDFDFTQPRHVTFDIAALQNWPEYQKGLIETLNPKTGKTVNEAIIDKYLHVIRELETKEPGVFKNVDVAEDTADPEIFLKEPQRSVINGFACHVNLLQGEKKARDTARFHEITGAFKLEAVLKDNFQCPPIPAIPARPVTQTTPVPPVQTTTN